MSGGLSFVNLIPVFWWLVELFMRLTSFGRINPCRNLGIILGQISFGKRVWVVRETKSSIWFGVGVSLCITK